VRLPNILLGGTSAELALADDLKAEIVADEAVVGLVEVEAVVLVVVIAQVENISAREPIIRSDEGGGVGKKESH